MDRKHVFPNSAFQAAAAGANIPLLLLLVLSFLPRPLTAQLSSALTLNEQAAHAQAQGDSAAAVLLYAKALEQDPAWAEGWWKYGALLFGAHRFGEADAAYTHLTRLAPENSLGFAMLGMCEYELADWNNASLHLNKALSKGNLPLDLANNAMFDFGLSLMRQHNRNGALIAFRFLQHYSPEYPGLLPALGSAELGMEQIPAPGTPNASAADLAGKAAMAVLRLKTTEAEPLYRQLIEQFPQLPYGHLCYGLFLENLGREAEAEKEFLAESQINATSPEPWIWLAKMALSRREGAKTREYANRAKELSPNDGLCYLLSGRSYAVDQQWSKALEDLQKAEALSPDSYEVHNALVTVYGELHDPQGVAAERRLLAKAYEITHQPGSETQ